MIIYNGNRMAVKLVVGEASDKGNPILISSADEMDNILANATSANVGKIYRYIGETTTSYKQGAYYVIKEDA